MPARLHPSLGSGKDSVPRVRASPLPTPEAFQPVAPGAKLPGENASQMKPTPEGLQPSFLRTPAGVRTCFQRPFPRVRNYPGATGMGTGMGTGSTSGDGTSPPQSGGAHRSTEIATTNGTKDPLSLMR